MNVNVIYIENVHVENQAADDFKPLWPNVPLGQSHGLFGQDVLDRDPIWARVTSPAFDWTVAVFVKRGPGLDWGRAGDRLGSGRGSMERRPGLSGALAGVVRGKSQRDAKL